MYQTRKDATLHQLSRGNFSGGAVGGAKITSRNRIDNFRVFIFRKNDSSSMRHLVFGIFGSIDRDDSSSEIFLYLEYSDFSLVADLTTTFCHGSLL